MLLRIAGSQGDLVSGVIEQQSMTPDDYGQQLANWTSFATVNVISCQPFSATSNSLESEQSLAPVTQVSVIVVCTYSPGVTNRMRIRIGERVLYIGYARNVRGLGKILNLYCGETIPA